jgi:hypothetical protein
MNSSTYLSRLTRMLALGAAVAAAFASAAAASVGRPPDVRDAADAIGLANLGSPPDVRDAAAAASVAIPDAFERYAASHPYGLTPSAATVVVRPPDVQDAADAFERYVNAHPYGAGPSTVTDASLVVRPPDVSDAGQAARAVSLDRATGGFDWGDYGVGIGTGIGIVLLLAGGLAGARQLRQRVQTA